MNPIDGGCARFLGGVGTGGAFGADKAVGEFHVVLDPLSLGLGLTAFVAVSLAHPRNRGAFLKTAPGVQRTRTSIALGTAKELPTVVPPE